MIEQPWQLFAFTATAVLVGVLTGLMAATFRIVLLGIGTLRNGLIGWAQGNPLLGFVIVVAASGGTTAGAAWLVHRVEPHAEGSGIPRVEGVVEGRTAPGSARILPVKYVGGLLAIGAGLALGREGPSVQMGGNIAIILSRLLKRNRHDMRTLVAAGAAAGLATAFNAPIAGGVFVLEELVKRFDPRTTVATLLASAAGFGSASLLLNGSSDFYVAPLHDPKLIESPLVLLVGVVAGLVGVLYNRAILASLRIADTSTWSVEARAALIGGAVGATGFFLPSVIGGGDNLTSQILTGEGTIIGAIGLLALRFVLGIISYAALTPGGLFAPMLVIGADIGMVIGLVGVVFVPAMTPDVPGMALIGMAAFFTATVRAPVTGLILATEMTRTVNMLPPMLGACAIAMLVAMMLRSEPIYDSLTARAVRNTRTNAREERAAEKAVRLLEKQAAEEDVRAHVAVPPAEHDAPATPVAAVPAAPAGPAASGEAPDGRAGEPASAAPPTGTDAGVDAGPAGDGATAAVGNASDSPDPGPDSPAPGAGAPETSRAHDDERRDQHDT